MIDMPSFPLLLVPFSAGFVYRGSFGISNCNYIFRPGLAMPNNNEMIFRDISSLFGGIYQYIQEYKELPQIFHHCLANWDELLQNTGDSFVGTLSSSGGGDTDRKLGPPWD